MKYVSGPDFPTGAIIYGSQGIKEAYETGRGKITLRAKATVEQLQSGKQNIVVTEIPYQVNKANLIEKIAELVKDKKIEGISDIRDESDKDGMRILIELKRDVIPEVILNNLYIHTGMQSTFGIIMLALVNGEPKVLNLKEMMQLFLDHRHEIVVKRTKFDLEAAEKRAHILEGLKKALNHIDEIIALIKKSSDPQEAKEGLMKKFKLSDIQSQAILDMRLQRLTGLERKKIEDEYRETIKLINRLKEILASKNLRMQIIKEELKSLQAKYGDNRRTEIVKDTKEFTLEDMIAEEDMVITISHDGLIKRFPVSGYRRQSRGGKGITAAVTKEEDFIEHMFIASTHNYILFFTDAGRCYCLKVHEIPQAGRTTKGKAIVNLISIQPDEKITAFLNVKEFDDKHYVVMVTEKGTVKKTVLSEFSNPRKSGIIAIKLDKGDNLIEARLTDGTEDIIIGTKEGIALRFHESDVRDMGRNAAGVKGITLEKRDHVIGMVNVKRKATILVVSENGFGKRSELEDYRVTHRGGKGIITLKATDKTGKLIAIREVLDEDDLMIITAKGVVIRIHVKDIRVMSRNTQGVKLIKLENGDKVTAVASVVREEEEEGEE
jgi:DNA gyrase subunit A